MAGVSIQLTVEDRAVQTLLRRILERTRDLRPALDEAAAVVENSTRARFRQQHDPQGNPWTPLSRRTLERRGGRTRKEQRSIRGQRAATSAQILIDTARLLRSITRQVDATEASVGTNVVYGRIHQLGGKAGRGHRVRIPARPYLGLSHEDREEVRLILSRHLATAMGGSR